VRPQDGAAAPQPALHCPAHLRAGGAAAARVHGCRRGDAAAGSVSEAGAAHDTRFLALSLSLFLFALSAPPPRPLSLPLQAGARSALTVVCGWPPFRRPPPRTARCSTRRRVSTPLRSLASAPATSCWRCGLWSSCQCAAEVARVRPAPATRSRPTVSGWHAGPQTAPLN
jgi:hypothetical protein